MSKQGYIEEEPILRENKDRFVLFPIEHNDIWEFYKKAEAIERLQAALHRDSIEACVYYHERLKFRSINLFICSDSNI